MIFYIEQDLDTKESALVKAHLDECSNCRFLCNQIEQSLKLFNEDKLTATNPFFVSRVMQGIKENTEKKSIFTWLGQKQYVLQTALYTATIVLSLLAGIYLGSGTTPQEETNLFNETEETDYQLFADSYDYQFNKNTYLAEVSDNEE